MVNKTETTPPPGSVEPYPRRVDSTHKYNIKGVEAAIATTTTATATDPESIQMASPYQEMLKREYDHAVDQEIKKGIQAISERFTRLYSQERNPTDTSPHDNLGHNSDYYERIVSAYHSGNSQVLAETTEELYTMLHDLDFTEMRKIEAIKQEYQQE